MDRRALVRAAVWTTPVIVTATAAPAFAASPCVGFSYPAPNAGTWTRVSTRVNQDSGNAFNATGYTLESDPTSSDIGGLTPASVIVTGPSVTFTAGRTYRISYSYTFVGRNPRDLTLTPTFGGAAQSGGVIATGSVDSGSGTKTFDVTPATTGARQIVLQFVFSSGTSSVGDDITVTNFAVTCRAAGT